MDEGNGVKVEVGTNVAVEVREGWAVRVGEGVELGGVILVGETIGVLVRLEVEVCLTCSKELTASVFPGTLPGWQAVSDSRKASQRRMIPPAIL